MKAFRSLVFIFMLCIPLLALSMPKDLFPPVSGWTCKPGEKVYTPDNLWDLIDGSAELYLSYGFVDLNTGEYSNREGIGVRVELYRHNSPVNAFGMYSQERNPDYHFTNVGTQGYIEDGVLNFLCGTYYVKITTDQPGKEGRDAMTLIAETLVRSLQQEPAWPPVLGLFPAGEKLPNTETYVSENYLGYTCMHSAFVADYGANERMKLFIIKLADAAEARQMASAFLKETTRQESSVKEGRFHVLDPHNGIVYLLLQDRYLCGVVNCGKVEKAATLLEALQLHLQ